MITYEVRKQDVIAMDGEIRAGICTFTDQDGIRTIEHTGVTDEYRGKGVAAELIRLCVKDAEEKKLFVEPVCSYAALQFEKHPEWVFLRKGKAV